MDSQVKDMEEQVAKLDKQVGYFDLS